MLKTTSIILLKIAFLMYGVAHAQYQNEDWEERDKWMPITQLFELADLHSGDNVADIGCHEGYLTFHLSNRVEGTGKVYAVDVRKDRLEILDNLLAERKIKNVQTIKGDYDNPKLPSEALDAVFIIDTYHEIEDYSTVLQHVKASLKTNGKLVLLEKLKKAYKDKSRTQQANGHTLSHTYVEKELKKAGFKIVSKITDLGTWNYEPEKQMWVLVAVPNH